MTQAVIAIIGGGIGGLTLSAALKKYGISAQIYEQAPSFGPVGAGLQLTANAVKALQGFGLVERLRVDGFAPRQHYSRDWATGEITNTLPMGETIESTYGVPDLSIHRAKAHGALAELVDPSAITYSKKLASITPEGGRVRLTFEDGATTLADAVVGADGLHSRVRDAVFGPEAPHYTGKVAYRSVFPSAAVKGPGLDERAKWWGPDSHIVSYLTTSDRKEAYFIAVVREAEPSVESWSARGDKHLMMASFAGFHPDILAVLDAGQDIRKWALFDREPMSTWGKGAITLLGDACHPMPPFIAQGAASAIEDAIVLARCIANDGMGNFEETFRRYEALRYPRTSRMQKAAKENNWLRQKTDPDWVYGYDAWKVDLTPPAQALA